MCAIYGFIYGGEANEDTDTKKVKSEKDVDPKFQGKIQMKPKNVDCVPWPLNRRCLRAYVVQAKGIKANERAEDSQAKIYQQKH